MPAWVGVTPFLGYVAVFLLWPVGIVVWTALHNTSGSWQFSSLSFLGQSQVRTAFVNTFELSLGSAVFGAVLGAVLAYAVATGDPDGAVRRVYITPETWDSPGSTKTMDELEWWCFACRTHYPHEPVEPD